MIRSREPCPRRSGSRDDLERSAQCRAVAPAGPETSPAAPMTARAPASSTEHAQYPCTIQKRPTAPIPTPFPEPDGVPAPVTIRRPAARRQGLSESFCRPRPGSARAADAALARTRPVSTRARSTERSGDAVGLRQRHDQRSRSGDRHRERSWLRPALGPRRPGPHQLGLFDSHRDGNHEGDPSPARLADHVQALVCGTSATAGGANSRVPRPSRPSNGPHFGPPFRGG